MKTETRKNWDDDGDDPRDYTLEHQSDCLCHVCLDDDSCGCHTCVAGCTHYCFQHQGHRVG